MANIMVTSVQQYTIDRIRVSLYANYDVSQLRNVTIRLLDIDGNDLSNHLKSTSESNAEKWADISETNVIDLYLQKNTSLQAGSYQTIICDNGVEVYSGTFTIGYMEDVRVTFGDVIIDSLHQIRIPIIPLDQANPTYQSMDMLRVMKISLMNEVGANYSASLTSLEEIISDKKPDDVVTELVLSIKGNEVIPKGKYTLRFTSLYKSRTFSIVEKEYDLPYMTNTPPEIGNSYVSINADGNTHLTVIFKSYLEKSMFLSSKFSIIMDKSGKEVTSHFNSVKIATQSNTTAGINYITRLDIPLITDLYTLEKGSYTINFKWDIPYIDDISCKMNCDWFLHDMEIILCKIAYLQFNLPEVLDYSVLGTAKIKVELDGEEYTKDTFASLAESNTFTEDKKFSKLRLKINKPMEIPKGVFTFILYYTNKDGEIEYLYGGDVDIIGEVTPDVESVSQIDVDTFHVKLAKEIPIEYVELCVPHLVDSFSGTSYDAELFSINQSNIWEPGQSSTDRFDIVIKKSAVIPSGNYTFYLSLNSESLKKVPLKIQYMETRKGIISSIIQTDLSHIKITFSKPQTRKFLLSTTLDVERKIDGANFTDRFELLENVLKADEYIISELVIPMDHEDSLASGRYTISFKYKITDGVYTTAYTYDVQLGYMSLNLPEISTVITSKDTSGKLNIKINFGQYLEESLFLSSELSLINPYDKNVINDFVVKSDWTTVTTTSKSIQYIKSLTLKARTTDIHFEQGTYLIKISWDEASYEIPVVTKDVFLEYSLPYTVEQEVTSYDSASNSARLYFKFDTILQYSFFEDLKVEVLNEYGIDHTEYFSTIQESNNIGPSTPESEKVSTDNINLDIINVEEISYGVYTIIFYHEKDGIRESEYMSKIDICAALVPSFLSIEQVGIDLLLINLKGSVPRMLLESYDVKFESFRKKDISNYFKSIDASNDWAEDVRNVSSFYLKLKSGYIVEEDTYLLTMYADKTELDSIDISIERMEGVSFDITSIDMVNLNSLTINFSDEQTVALFKTFSLVVETLDGMDVSEKFQELSKALSTIGTDFFESIDISVVSDVPNGWYTFTFVRYNNGVRNNICSFSVNLTYMSNVYPILYDASSSQTADGDNAIIMWFSPALELNLYENAKFFFTNVSGVDMSHKLIDREDAVLDTEVINDITYVNYVTMDFKPDSILDKGDYTVSFDWDGDYTYMKKLTRDVSLDYIILPVESVKVLNMETVQITFKEPHTGAYLQNCVLHVDSIYESTNIDGTVVTDVDFSSLFTLDVIGLDAEKEYYSVNAILNVGGKIPTGRYRFIISEYDDSVKTMVYAYGGNLLIQYMENSEASSFNVEIKQTSIDTLSIIFDEFQNIDFFNMCEFSIFKGDTDYSRYFKAIDCKDPKESEIIVDTIHYSQKIAKEFILVLAEDKAIPSGSYTLACKNESTEVFSKEFSTLFMTSTPAEITSMNIDEDRNLVIQFDPYAEETSLLDATYALSCQAGIDELGNIIEKDVSENLAPMSNIETNIIETNGIRYVNEMRIPIKDNATLASGRYIFYLNWHPNYFMNPIKYMGGLSILAIGIKSAYTIAQDTIKIVFNEKWNIDYLKELNFSVVNLSGNDCTDLFQSIDESNKNISSGTETDTICLCVDDDVLANTYTFTLSERTYDSEGELTLSPRFQFDMCITYLTDEFSVITKADNFSNEKFEIIKITNANASSYIGYYVQLTTSTEKELLTDENVKDYLNKEAKVFSKASIDRLTLKFNDEVHACLLAACDVSISDDEGKVYTDRFKSIPDSNTFVYRTVLDYIVVEFPESHTGDYYESLDITVKKKDGTDISAMFDTVEESNELEDDIKTSIFNVQPSEGTYIEESDLTNLKVGIVDENGSSISRAKYTFKTTKIATVNQIELMIEDGETLPSGEYSMSLSYQNEPSIEGSTVITAFTHSGIFPFLSSNIGYITNVEQISLSKIAITFSEDLPTALFSDVQLSVLDEDGESYESLFTSLTETNSFENVETLSELDDPYTIFIELAMGETLKAGRYTIQFTTDICANSEEEMDESESDEEDTSGIYTLWKYTTSVSYMIKEMQNVIKSVTMVDIDTLKFELERPIDVTLLQDYAVTAKCESSEYVYGISSFKPISKSNNLGLYIMLSESRYVFYSETGSSWNRYDTGSTIDLNGIVYDQILEKYLIVGSRGKVLEVDSFKSIAKATEISTPVNSTLNSIIRLSDRYVVVGNDGVILIGMVKDSSISWKKIESGTSYTLTTVISLSEKELLAVGYCGVILYSKDSGDSWEKVMVTNTGINLTSAIKFKSSGTTPDSDEDGVADSYRDGVYVIGTKGTILYSPNGHFGWEMISVDTKASLFGITSHENKIVIVGEVGTVITSDDTIHWSVIDSGLSVSLKNVAYCDTQYFACGSSGKWVTSNSGNSWTVNSSIYGDSFKNVMYSPSQYEDNRKISYFYLKLAADETLGAVNFFKGTEVPTLENKPASYWETDQLKDIHIGDIYTRYETLYGITNNMEMYQFGIDTIVNEDGTVSSGDYRWIPESESNIYTSFATDYEFEIVQSDGEEILLESGEKAIQPKYGVPITYMTSNPGTVKSVEICSPDAEDSIEYEYPYIKVNLSHGDENAIYYASFSVTDKNGNDFTHYFKSLRTSGYEYDSDFTVKTVFIYGNPANIMSIPSGEYTFEWIWFATTKISKTFYVKNISQLINNVTRVVKTNDLNVIFNNGKTLPLDFFVANNKTLDINITKIPTANTDDMSYNYYQKFKDVLESTEFSNPEVCTDGKVKRFILAASDHAVIKNGEYLLKLRNEKNPTETDDTMMITTHRFTLDQELINEQPTLGSVKAMMRSKTVEKLDPTATVQYYEGIVDPTYSDTLTSNWRASGETELRSHVGDIYTNTTTQKTFSFCYLNDAGIYNWVQNTNSPYLVVSMGDARPTFKSIMSYMTTILLYETYTEKPDDLTDVVECSPTEYRRYLMNYLKVSVDYWEFECVTSDDIKYVSKIFIPFDTDQNFPGASNATFKMCWSEVAPFDSMELTGFTLPMITKDYGSISKVVASKINEQTETTDETYGIYVEFTKNQYVSFLKECSLSLTHEITDDSGNVVVEDVAGLFNSIEESNQDIFKGVTTINHLWLTLPESQVIEPGTYTLEISGFKPDADLTTEEDDNSVVSFTHETYIPYVSNTLSNDCTAKFETGVSGYSGYPILSITFIHTSAITGLTSAYPNISDFGIWSLKVTEQSTGTDVSDRFRTYKSTIIGFTYDKANPNLVKCIHIPLKQGVALRKGSYDVSFTFDKTSVIGTVPYSGKLTSFMVAEDIITKVGEFSSLKVEDKGKKVSITTKLFNSLNTEAKLKASSIGTVLGIKTYTQLFKKMDLEFVNGSGDHRETYLKSPKFSGKKVTYTIRDNHKINPCNITVRYRYKGVVTVKAKTFAFKGMIRNVVGGALKDKVCYILLEKHDGVSKRRVYKSYNAMQSRIKKLKKINEHNQSQCDMCKKCRKHKVLQTKKIKAPIEKYSFKDGKRVTLFKKMSVWYYKGILSKKTKCKSIAFKKFNDVSDDAYDKIHCDNYMKKATTYTWSLAIATMGSKFPKKGKPVHIVWINKRGIELARAFKAGKKGKKSSACKKYKKNKIDKHIKKYKNKVSACAKCKKRELAIKGSTTIGWNTARFPIALKTSSKYAKQITKLVNQLYKTKSMGGCKKAKFKLVKHSTTLCKLSCSNTVAADKELSSGVRKATMSK